MSIEVNSLLEHVWDLNTVSKYVNNLLSGETNASRVSLWLVDGQDAFVCVNDVHHENVIFEHTYRRGDVRNYYIEGDEVTDEVRSFSRYNGVVLSLKSSRMISEQAYEIFEVPLVWHKKFIGFIRLEINSEIKGWLRLNEDVIVECKEMAINSLAPILRFNEISKNMAQRGARQRMIIRKNDAALKLTTNGMVIVDATGYITEVTDAAKRIFNYKNQQMIGLSLYDLCPDVAEIAQPEADQRSESRYMEVTCFKRHGEEFKAACACVRIEESKYVTWAFRDISDIVEAEEKVKRIQLEMQNDALTGVLSRGCVDKRLEQIVDFAEDCQTSTVIALIDIDDFKKFNDTYGHAVGDIVLRNTAEVMSNSARETDLVGRYGGEEFLIVLPDTTMTEASFVLERMRKDVESSKMRAEGTEVMCTVSIGYDICHNMQGLQQALKNADTAMYKSKTAGKNRVTGADDPQLSLFKNKTSNNQQKNN